MSLNANAGKNHWSLSPQYELSMIPIEFVWITPKFLNVDERGANIASYPSGNSIATPRLISLKSPLSNTTSSAAPQKAQEQPCPP